MTQRSRVPQFGNWANGENVLYTVCFDNARKDKNGGKMINPNDPQQNPDFFPADRPPAKATPPSRNRVEPEAQFGQGVVRPKIIENRSTRSTDTPSRHDPYHQQHSDYGASSRDNSRKPSQQNGRPEHGGIEQSPVHLQYPAKSGSRGGSVPSPSWERKPSEGNHGLAPRSPITHGTSRLRTHEKTAAIPKFGDWDEKNPSASEGYTVIFNRVREDKHTATANVITTQQEPTPNRRLKPSSRDNDMMRCCFL